MKRHSSKILGNNSFRNNLKVPKDKGHALDYKSFLLVSNHLSSCPWSMAMYTVTVYRNRKGSSQAQTLEGVGVTEMLLTSTPPSRWSPKVSLSLSTKTESNTSSHLALSSTRSQSLFSLHLISSSVWR